MSFRLKRHRSSDVDAGRGTSRPRVEDNTNTAWDTFRTLLHATGEASDAFPPLKSATVGLKFILDTFERTEDNLAAVVKLQRRIEKTMELVRRADDDADKEARLTLSKNLDSITQNLRIVAQKSSYERTMKSLKQAELLRDFVTEVDQSLLNYQTTLLQDVHKHGNDLLAADEWNTLYKLARARDAGHKGDDNRSGCLQGTRKDVLRELQNWVDDRRPEAKRVYWLNGHAGSGKSAIAQSFANLLEDYDELGASFFCSRDSEERSNLKTILPTIAYQLSVFSKSIDAPKYRKAVLRALKANPDIASAALREQMEELIIGPVFTSKLTAVVIVDALDECSDPDATSIFFDLLLRFIKDMPSLKFFITSRPEMHIQSTFRLPHPHPMMDMLVLHECYAEDVRADIHLFLRTKLAIARTRRSILGIPDDWPTNSELEALTDKSGGLFIFAATAVKLIETGSRDPRDQLQILATSASSMEEGASGLDNMYMDILGKALSPSVQNSNAHVERLRTVLGLLVVAKETMLQKTIATILDMERQPTDVLLILDRLRSVLLIPDAEDQNIRFHHKSFPDFLTDAARCKDRRFFISTHHHHFSTAERCLNVMNKALKKNICGIPRYTMNGMVSADLIDQRISAALRYSCRFWVDHLIADKDPSESCLSRINQSLCVFLTAHQLHWFEVLTLLKELKLAVYSLGRLHNWFVSCTSQRPLHDLVDWVIDGRRFVLYAFDTIKASVAHIYHSALPLAPASSLLRMSHAKDFAHEAEVIVGAEKRWSGSLRTIQDFYGLATDIVFSHDGSKLAITLDLGYVGVYDSYTGENVMELDDPNTPRYAAAVAFSPDDQSLATLLRFRDNHSTTIVLTDMRTGTRTASIDVSASIPDFKLAPQFITFCSERQLLIASIPVNVPGSNDKDKITRVILDIWDTTTQHRVHSWEFPSAGAAEVEQIYAYILRINAMPLFITEDKSSDSPCDVFWEIADPPQRYHIASDGPPSFLPGSISKVAAFCPAHQSQWERHLVLDFCIASTNTGSLALSYHHESEAKGCDILLCVQTDLTNPGKLPSVLHAEHQRMVVHRAPPTKQAVGRHLAFSPDRKTFACPLLCGGESTLPSEVVNLWEIEVDSDDSSSTNSAYDCPKAVTDSYPEWDLEFCSLSPDGRLLVYNFLDSEHDVIRVGFIDRDAPLDSDHLKILDLSVWGNFIIAPGNASVIIHDDDTGKIVVYNLDKQAPSQEIPAYGFNLPNTNTLDLQLTCGLQVADLEDTLCCARYGGRYIEFWSMATVDTLSPDSTQLLVLSATGHLPLDQSESIQEVSYYLASVDSGKQRTTHYFLYVKTNRSRTYFAPCYNGLRAIDNSEQLHFKWISGSNEVMQFFHDANLNYNTRVSFGSFLTYDDHRDGSSRDTLSDVWGNWILQRKGVLQEPRRIFCLSAAYDFEKTDWYYSDKYLCSSSHDDYGYITPGSFTIVDFSRPNALDPNQPF